MSFCSCCLFLCVNSFLHQPSWRPWTKSLWFSAVWGYNRAKTECATPPKLATENWVIPSASWLVLDDRLGGGRQQPCNPPVRFKHDRDYSSSAQSNPVEWNWEICDLFCMVWFCFTPHFSSLAWYLGHKGTAFSRQKPGAYCPLVPLPPICNWKHTNGLAGESSMPVGLLRRPVHSDPLTPQRGVGERETHTDRERGI